MINFKCNNIAVICKGAGYSVEHVIPKHKDLRALLTTCIVNCLKCWYITVGTNSVVLIETIFKMSAWKDIWQVIQKHYDNMKPNCSKKISKMKNNIYQILESYIESNLICIVVLPRLKDVYGSMKMTEEFSAYKITLLPSRSENSVLIDNSFEALCYDATFFVLKLLKF